MTEQPSLRAEEGLRAAYAAHALELYGFAVRVLGDPAMAEEATEETFLRAWRWAERYRPTKGSVRNWLFAVHSDVVADLRRASMPRPTSVDAGLDWGREHDGLHLAINGWLAEEAIGRLGEDHRRVLMDACFEDRSLAEIGSDLDVDETTVRSRVLDAIRALRDALEDVEWARGE